MIVQLIGTKYVQICEAVGTKSRTQSTTHIWDGQTRAQTDGRTHRHESYVPRLARGTKSDLIGHMNIKLYFDEMVHGRVSLKIVVL